MLDKEYLPSLVVVLALLLLALLVFSNSDGFTIDAAKPVRARLDGSVYRVHYAHDNPHEAAEILAEINRRLTKLLAHLKRKYFNTAADSHAAAFPGRIEAVRDMLRRYNPDVIVENSPTDPNGDTAYVIGKGDTIALCLRYRNSKSHKLHDLDILTFVAVHELTHMSIDDMDHPARFWSAFKWMLSEADEAGIYTPRNYENAAVEYCGLNVDYSPAFDPKLEPFI